MLVLQRLLDNEMKKANEDNDPFHSRHEAFAVLKEELEELIIEINDIESGIIDDYWAFCTMFKNKNSVSNSLVKKGYYSTYGDKKVIDLLDNLEKSVMCGITELIQVGAMIKKAKILENKED
jgi:hypothetical protein